jgi:energy-coupling factor transport system ATP-binding protein
VIEIYELSYRYLGRTEYALKNVELKIERGEFVLITGRSGCGKSTLLKCLNGLIPHESYGDFSGNVIVDGLNTKDHPISVLAQKVGLVFQNPDEQIFSTKVLQEVAFGCENLRLPKEEIIERVEWALGKVGMEKYMHANTNALSGGQKQRVAIASVLALKPDVIALDEPLSHLDPRGVKEVLDVLKTLNEEGMTIVLVEHRIPEVLRIVDRIVVMDKGRIITDGDPEDVLRSGVLERLALRQPGMCYVREKREARIKEKVVEIRDVWFSYNGEWILRGVSLDVYRGEVLAILGNNGSGKTTLLHHIAGILKPKRGSVIVLGRSTKKFGPYKLAGIVGIVFQNPSLMLFCDTVYDEVAFGPRNLKLKDVDRAVRRWIDVMELKGFENVHPQTLSGGERLRCATAAILSMQPEIILLDEPTSGQDFMHAKKLMDVCVELATKGKSVIFVTHDIELAVSYATRIVVMENGKVVAELSNPRVDEVEKLLLQIPVS